MSPAQVEISGAYAAWRDDWLASYREEVLDPALPIVDAHHHLWDRADSVYMFDQLLADMNMGHNIIATVFCECRSMYRASGPEAYRSVGEVEFVNGAAAMSASGIYGPSRICAGIVGSLDLRAPEAADVLDNMVRVGGGRFKGMRQISAWDADERVSKPMATRPKGLLGDAAFRRGFAQLAPRGLNFDAYLFHAQLPELISLARDFPQTQIMVDHIGTPVGVGAYAGHRDEIFQQWRTNVRELAKLPNVSIKLGGMGMTVYGFDFHQRPKPVSSVEIAKGWRPYIETCIEAFGPERTMFESNFPPDKGTCSYLVLWNAFKRIAEGCSSDVKAQLFSGTAKRFYRLSLDT